MNVNDVFIWESEVRNNEIDFQGIVNNANYFNYLAQARCNHLKFLGIDIVAMHDSGFDMVLIRTEMDFKSSLKDGDGFIVTSKLEAMSRVRLACVQQIFRKSDQKVMVEAKTIVVCIAKATGKPIVPDELKSIFSLK
ncbi:MAG: acyl-CoA thioesterase [Gammaproteobacteria bacterium]|nr:acyl-CoA thioesterase [Gammaproteobacteria bacterium]